MTSGKKSSPVFIGNSLKCALNSIAALKVLGETRNTPEYYKWINKPFPVGFQKSFPVYYVDKKLLHEESSIRKELVGLLLANTNWPGMEIKIEQRKEEREMLILRVLDSGFYVASVFIRNSGTEDKLVLYLRGREEWALRLEELSEVIYPFLQITFKNKQNPMARAEQKVLQILKNNPMMNEQSIVKKFSKIPVDQLLHEMCAKQKLIYKDGDGWKITKMGRKSINFSERSEKNY